MDQSKRRPRNRFRRFEQIMTLVILGELAAFLLMLAASAFGIGWLRWTLSIAVLAVSAMGTALLVLKQEHRHPRSRWMSASFLGLFVCTLVSLLTGFPAPN